ncbi:MAG TPA: hypothetical protein VMF13_20745, partial [Luteitalea sp.]|nr:hypothetical protein [Luteitalea sp.]
MAALVVSAGLLALTTIYPFLPGRFDRLAVPLSTMVQVFGVLGMALVPVGLTWAAAPRYAFALAVIATVVGTGIALVLALFAVLSVGNAFGVLTLVTWAYVLVRIVPYVLRLRRDDARRAGVAPLYLVLMPAFALAAQLGLSGSLS